MSFFGPLQVYLEGTRLQELTTGNPFNLLLTQNLVTLTDPAIFGVTDKKVKLLQSSADYVAADPATVHVVCSVEGCHTLSSRLQHFDPGEIIANLVARRLYPGMAWQARKIWRRRDLTGLQRFEHQPL